MTEPLVLTVPEVAKMLHRSRPRIYEMVRSGEIEAIVDNCGPRGRILIPRDAVDAWITRKRRQSRR